MTKIQKIAMEKVLYQFSKIPDGDSEKAHLVADGCLLEFVKDIGFGNVVSAWYEVRHRAGGFWYS